MSSIPPDRSWPPTEPLRYPSYDDDDTNPSLRGLSAPDVSGRHVLPGDSSMPNDATIPALPPAPGHTQWSIQEYTSAPIAPRTHPGERKLRRRNPFGRTLVVLAIGALIGLVAGALIFVAPSLFGQLGSGTGHGFPITRHNTPTPSPTPTPPPPIITGSLAPAPTNGAINLTAEGTLDWAHWGLTSASDFDHKAHADLISNYTPIKGIGPFQYGSYPVGFSWSDGTPDASALNSTTGVLMFAKGGGFSFTVPAGRDAHTVLIYVSVYQTQGKLTASLSDHSAPTYADSSLINSSGNTYAVYTLTYRAASDGQTLTITFTSVNDYGFFGSVSLQSVALQ